MKARPASIFLTILLFVALSGCIVDTPPHAPDKVGTILADLLNDPDPVVRRNAAISLGRLGHGEAAGDLVARLSDPEPVVRQFSAWALGRLGDSVLDQAGVPLAELLTDPSPSVKESAARALTEVGATQVVVEIIAQAVLERDVATRRAAVQALAGIESVSAYPVLVDLLRDQDARVRQGAVSALGELADERAVAYFHERLVEDSDEGVRTEAAYRLGKLGTPKDVDVLERAVRVDRSASVKRWAGWAVDELKSLDGLD